MSDAKTAVTSTELETFFSHCNNLATYIENNRELLIELLVTYETHEAAEDEIVRSIDALRGAKKEFSTLEKPLKELHIATIFPLNLPLYSLVIFGLMPSAFASKVYIRPPEVMHNMLSQLWDFLNVSINFPNILLKAVPRQVFVQLYAAECDVIIFTGKYENALAIHEQCPQSLLIYNGSGVNPFIVFENADLDLAVKKAVEMRCFNSGQDCAGPDAFFVPSSLADSFVQKLESHLDTIKVGNTTDPEVKVGPTMKQAYITELENWLENEKQYMVYGGKIDFENHLVYPSIVRKKITSGNELTFHEFFAPYFLVLEYESIDDLKEVINQKSFQQRGMYVSVFGDNQDVESQLTFVQILKNVIVNDVEYGNDQYGGYGERANFVLLGENKAVHPLLISRDMHATLSP